MIIRLFLSFSFFLSVCIAQKVTSISHDTHSDSSLYSVVKISSNEFWVSGKHGYLKKIDSLGNFAPIVLSPDSISPDLNILKIVRSKNYIFLITNNAIIYRYDTITKVFIKRKFKEFKGKCFYDMLVLPDGKLMVCGGATGISRGKKALPFGYIAFVDDNLEHSHIVWRCYRKFVWSLLKLQNGSVLAATFNGQNSHLIKTDNFTNWKNERRIKGLVYQISQFDGDVWYSGSKSIFYKKDGTFGSDEMPQTILPAHGCVWAMEKIGEKLAMTTTNGKLILKDLKTAELKEIATPSLTSIYDIEKVSESKYFLVGNGKAIFLVDFNQK